ncbi:MAG: glycosyltransferase [Coriobacteriia bacterium]|nr:glycosyltransferase [Coriobacteriia bacterium]
MYNLVLTIAESDIYKVTLIFFALYPMFMALVWIWSSIIYFFRREHRGDMSFYEVADEDLPAVSIIVPAYHEELTVARTLGGLLQIDYPDFEIIVVNDASDDDTLAEAQKFIHDSHVRIIDKRVNEGKAMAINDALPLASGEIIMVVDGDAVPDSDVLRWVVPHFLHNPRLAAVTGNPRVRNPYTLLAKIQTIEFSSIISLLKRSQVVWGRVMTVSGVIGVYRKSALEDVGLCVHDCVTEDISTSWEFQRRYYDIRYEPRAMVRMQVPHTLRALWSQRLRWARGLAQTLRRNAGVWRHWRNRRIWPVYLEASLSILWAYSFMILTTMWLITWVIGAPLLGATPIPEWWGMLIGTISLTQLAVGVLMDRKYDPDVARYYFWAALYPLVYWFQMSIITCIATPGGLLHPKGPGTWRTPRSAD